jgi:hypothetical protein
MKTKLLRILSLPCLLGISACANPGTEHASDRWRRAQVVRVLSDAEATRLTHVTCQNALPHVSGQQLVLVSHTFGGNPHLKTQRIAAASSGVSMKAGDPVVVNSQDCRAPLRGGQTS